MKNYFIDERDILLDGAKNVRDLGGYKTKSGKVTKKGRFVRASGLEDLTKKDIQKLIDLGLSIDIDLRMPEEIMQWKDCLQDNDFFIYKNISLLSELKSKPQSLSELYILALYDCQKAFYDIFQFMITHISKGIIFHCSAGKDRTGIIAAMLLELAEVDTEDIKQNYEVSAEKLGETLSKYGIENQEDLKAYLDSDVEHIVDFLFVLRQRQGGIFSYLLKIGIKEKDILMLKESFLLNE